MCGGDPTKTVTATDILAYSPHVRGGDPMTDTEWLYRDFYSPHVRG